MLDKAVAALKADRAKALRAFNEGGGVQGPRPLSFLRRCLERGGHGAP